MKLTIITGDWRTGSTLVYEAVQELYKIQKQEFFYGIVECPEEVDEIIKLHKQTPFGAIIRAPLWLPSGEEYDDNLRILYTYRNIYDIAALKLLAGSTLDEIKESTRETLASFRLHLTLAEEPENHIGLVPYAFFYRKVPGLVGSLAEYFKFDISHEDIQNISYNLGAQRAIRFQEQNKTLEEVATFSKLGFYKEVLTESQLKSVRQAMDAVKEEFPNLFD